MTKSIDNWRPVDRPEIVMDLLRGGLGGVRMTNSQIAEIGGYIERLEAVAAAAAAPHPPIAQPQAAESRLVELARKAATRCDQRHAYMPATPQEAQTWHPHRWVVDAMLLAQEQPQAAGWRPIETAPHGQRVLLARKSGRVQIDDWADYCNYNHPEFTHWQPLPEPPKEGA